MKLPKLLPLLTAVALLPLLSTAQVETSPTLFGALRARHLGPAVMSGRITTLAVVPDQPEVIYVGSAGGGIWKTVSGGALFTPVFDDHNQSIGKIAIAPSDSKIIYVGTGEPWVRNSVSIGDGVYKSTNGGTDWQQIGLAETERIGDIVIHPTNPDVAYVAALGQLWSANPERGVFKTTDGGKSWEKILYVDENTGATDVEMDPRNPEVIYATTWSFRRYPWSFDSGLSGGSGVYKSTDGGKTWNKIQQGLPKEKLGRMAIAVAPSNGDVLYLSVETKSQDGKGLYLSTDGGANWRKVSNDFNTTVRPFYFSNLIVDPNNDSIVVKAGLAAIISENRGTTFRSIDGSVHSDIHDMWIDPNNGKHVLVATDGGVYESFDRGYTFKMWMNLPVSQFYHVSVDNAKPFNVYGGLQDNGSWYAPSRKAGGVGNSDWKNTYGGDGFYSFRHPENPDIIFSEYQGGELVRFNEKTGQAKSITPYPTAGEEKYRFNWNTPIHLSPNNPRRMYFASQYLFMSEDMGDSWTRISPDLTTDNPEKQKQHLSGGLSIDNSTAENHTTIYAIAESPRDGQIVWAGTDDGNLQVTADGGKSWTNVAANVPGLPANTWVTYVEPSPHDARTAFVTFDGHRTGDKKTYLYKTTDLGKTWTNLVTDDLSGYALSVRQDLVASNLLFLGTEFGLFISLDGGNSWARFTNNMPKVGVRDMVIHPRDHALVLATHGRGVVILDDITPLRQLTPEVAGEKVAFLKTAPTLLRDPGSGGDWFGGSGNFRAENPGSAAEVVYFMNSRHTFGKMYVEVYKDGKLIKTLPAGKSAGINVVEMPTSLPKPKAAPTNNRMALFGSLFGPNLAAGSYDVKLIKGKDTYTTTFELAYDPDAPYTVADRETQHETLMKLYNASEELAYLYHVLDRVQQQADSLDGLKKKLQQQADTLARHAQREKAKLVALEGDFYVDEGEKIREQISTLYYKVSTYPGRPSNSQIAETNRLVGEMKTIRQRFDNFLSKEVAALNTALTKSGLAALTYPSQDEFLSEEGAAAVGSSEGGSRKAEGGSLWSTVAKGWMVR